MYNKKCDCYDYKYQIDKENSIRQYQNEMQKRFNIRYDNIVLNAFEDFSYCSWCGKKL